MPIAADKRSLGRKQGYRRSVLVRGELVRILDPELRLLLHEVDGCIGDIDRAVIGLHTSLVALAVGKGLLLEYDRPALRCLFEDIGIIGEHIRAPLIRDAVMHDTTE